jgi:hydrogenase-4 component F
MNDALFLWLLFLLPAVLAGGCLLARSARAALRLASVGGVGWACLAAGAAWHVFARGPILAGQGWLYLDALSAYHALVLALVFGASSVYAWGYFTVEMAHAGLTAGAARRFGALWFGAAGAMALVLVSNNLGLMWVGIEATTLLTAFLICVHVSPLALEATWKYLVVCSVGVAFAFVGTLFVGVSAARLGLAGSEMLLWTRLSESAGLLSAGSMKLAFLFLVVGYGTKAGVAPLHMWLPDAHSQAPAPVSALFSGFMLSTALYCILRYLPLVERATGHQGWARDLLAAFGLGSILLAAAFIPFQRDGKRFLAYSSVEHVGIIALGVGLGGVGILAALWHTLNHAIAKPLAFFSVGRLGQMYGTHDLRALSGAMRRAPVWGAGFFGSVLALIGVAPFALFMSEFQVLRAAADARAFTALVLFLLGLAIVFVGALKHAIAAWGDEVKAPTAAPGPLSDAVVVWAGLGLLLLLGLWMPGPLRAALDAAALIVGGRP